MTLKKLLPFLFVLTWAASALGLPADQDDLLENTGTFTPQFFAELQDLELMGDRAYVFGVGGLVVVDISSPDNPFQLGRYEPPGHPFNRFYRGAVEDNLALGGGREDLLSVMRLAGGGSPVLLTVHGQPGQSYKGVTIRNQMAYACRHGDGLEIIDFSQGMNPVPRGQVTSLVNSWDVELNGNYAYVADGAGGLAIVDISIPTAPLHLTSLTTSGSANDVAVEGNLAVVCCGSAGIDVFTLNDPANPLKVGHANTSSLAIGARLMGTTVYVADWSHLRLYRSGPSTIGDIDISVEHLDFGNIPVGAVRDTTIIIGNTGGQNITVSQIVDFSDSYSITTPSSFTIPAGETRELGIRFEHLNAGYAGTFIRITSDDPDEGTITFPLTADDNPNTLNIGETAPDFSLTDMGGVVHTLQENLGRVVVMAFFANW